MAENPMVTIKMNSGKLIKAELYPDIAPNSVNNFIKYSIWKNIEKTRQRLR